MKLEVHETKNGDFMVKCPRVEKLVDSSNECHKCYWCSIATAEFVRCRWTQEKEDIKTGRRYYETS